MKPLSRLCGERRPPGMKGLPDCHSTDAFGALWPRSHRFAATGSTPATRLVTRTEDCNLAASRGGLDRTRRSEGECFQQSGVDSALSAIQQPREADGSRPERR